MEHFRIGDVIIQRVVPREESEEEDDEEEEEEPAEEDEDGGGSGGGGREGEPAEPSAPQSDQEDQLPSSSTELQPPQLPHFSHSQPTNPEECEESEEGDAAMGEGEEAEGEGDGEAEGEREGEAEEEGAEEEVAPVSVMESEELLREVKAEPQSDEEGEEAGSSGLDEHESAALLERLVPHMTDQQQSNQDDEEGEDQYDDDSNSSLKRKAGDDDSDDHLSKKKKSDETCDPDEKEKGSGERKVSNLRRNIREVMDETQLDEATLAAQRQEMERLRRVQDQQKYLREVQKQITVSRVQNKTQTKVLSLLSGSGATTIMKSSPQGSPKPSTVLVKLSSSGGPPQVLNKKTLEVLRSGSNSDMKSNICRLPSTKSGMVTPSVSIAPVKPASSSAPSPAPTTPKSKDSDVVEISSSSDEDDCIVISEPSEDESGDEAEDPANSGMHTNDLFNTPDEQGQVLINVGKPDGEPDVFLAPQIARIIKPHQIGGVRFMFDNVVESLERFKTSPGFGCILAHSMGLGKTLQVVSFCDVFLRDTGAKSVMCIMPINTLQNWMAEFNMWLPADPTNTPLAQHGEVRPRNFSLFVLNDLHKTLSARAKVVQDWTKEGGVLLIGYEMYRQLSMRKNIKPRKGKKKIPEEDLDDEKCKPLFDEVYEALVKPGPDLVICDEGHRIKNSHASISTALKQIRTKRRIVLTGYPLQNNLLEYWCMVDFVRPNYLGSKAEFSNMFERPIQNGQCIDSTPQDIRLMRYRAHVLHSLLEGFVQRRSHAVLRNSLPQKEEYVLLVRMTTFQRKLYDRFMNDVVRTKAVPNPLKAFAVCCKIWNHPDILYNFLRKREMDELQDLDLEEAVLGESKNAKDKKGKGKKGQVGPPGKDIPPFNNSFGKPDCKDGGLQPQGGYPPGQFPYNSYPGQQYPGYPVPPPSSSQPFFDGTYSQPGYFPDSNYQYGTSFSNYYPGQQGYLGPKQEGSDWQSYQNKEEKGKSPAKKSSRKNSSSSSSSSSSKSKEVQKQSFSHGLSGGQVMYNYDQPRNVGDPQFPSPSSQYPTQFPSFSSLSTNQYPEDQKGDRVRRKSTESEQKFNQFPFENKDLYQVPNPSQSQSFDPRYYPPFKKEENNFDPAFESKNQFFNQSYDKYSFNQKFDEPSKGNFPNNFGANQMNFDQKGTFPSLDFNQGSQKGQYQEGQQNNQFSSSQQSSDQKGHYGQFGVQLDQRQQSEKNVYDPKFGGQYGFNQGVPQDQKSQTPFISNQQQFNPVQNSGAVDQKNQYSGNQQFSNNPQQPDKSQYSNFQTNTNPESKGQFDPKYSQFGRNQFSNQESGRQEQQGQYSFPNQSGQYDARSGQYPYQGGAPPEKNHLSELNNQIEMMSQREGKNKDNTDYQTAGDRGSTVFKGANLPLEQTQRAFPHYSGSQSGQNQIPSQGQVPAGGQVSSQHSGQINPQMASTQMSCATSSQASSSFNPNNYNQPVGNTQNFSNVDPKQNSFFDPKHSKDKFGFEKNPNSPRGQSQQYTNSQQQIPYFPQSEQSSNQNFYNQPLNQDFSSMAAPYKQQFNPNADQSNQRYDNYQYNKNQFNSESSQFSNLSFDDMFTKSSNDSQKKTSKSEKGKSQFQNQNFNPSVNSPQVKNEKERPGYEGQGNYSGQYNYNSMNQCGQFQGGFHDSFKSPTNPNSSYQRKESQPLNAPLTSSCNSNPQPGCQDPPYNTQATFHNNTNQNPQQTKANYTNYEMDPMKKNDSYQAQPQSNFHFPDKEQSYSYPQKTDFGFPGPNEQKEFTYHNSHSQGSGSKGEFPSQERQSVQSSTEKHKTTEFPAYNQGGNMSTYSAGSHTSGQAHSSNFPGQAYPQGQYQEGQNFNYSGYQGQTFNTQQYPSVPSGYQAPFQSNNCSYSQTSGDANGDMIGGQNKMGGKDKDESACQIEAGQIQALDKSKPPETEKLLEEEIRKEAEAKEGENSKDENKDDKKSDAPTSLSTSTIAKSSKEEPGIPYDWAIELMKGYVPGRIEESAKMLVFFCILEESIALGDRILVFSQSLFTLNLMEELLQQQLVPGRPERWMRNVNYYRLDGSTTASEREKLINEFNSNPNFQMFLVSTRAGSLGINLVGANRVIVFDASWNPCHDTQAVCRVYRYGQKKPCFVYRIVTDNSLEKKIYDRQINKQGMADRVVDECNPEAHLSIKEVTSLCWDDKEDNPKAIDIESIKDNYIDVVIQKVLERHHDVLTKEPFQHESLLVERKDKKLSQAEKRQAKRSYELEKQANSNSSRPLYSGQATVQTRGGMKPMASVRPMQSEQLLKDGKPQARGWIPAAVWQRQGMSAQEMTLPLDVVIPTNAPDKASIVLKAGQKVMVLKSPKGIYMQLESGKIIAIRTAVKMGLKDKKLMDGKPNEKKVELGGRPRGTVLPTLRNTSVSIVPRSSATTSIRPGMRPPIRLLSKSGVQGKTVATARPYMREPEITMTPVKKKITLPSNLASSSSIDLNKIGGDKKDDKGLDIELVGESSKETSSKKEDDQSKRSSPIGQEVNTSREGSIIEDSALQSSSRESESSEKPSSSIVLPSESSGESSWQLESLRSLDSNKLVDTTRLDLNSAGSCIESIKHLTEPSKLLMDSEKLSESKTVTPSHPLESVQSVESSHSLESTNPLDPNLHLDTTRSLEPQTHIQPRTTEPMRPLNTHLDHRALDPGSSISMSRPLDPSITPDPSRSLEGMRGLDTSRIDVRPMEVSGGVDPTRSLDPARGLDSSRPLDPLEGLRLDPLRGSYPTEVPGYPPVLDPSHRPVARPEPIRHDKPEGVVRPEAFSPYKEETYKPSTYPGYYPAYPPAPYPPVYPSAFHRPEPSTSFGYPPYSPFPFAPPQYHPPPP